MKGNIICNIIVSALGSNTHFIMLLTMDIKYVFLKIEKEHHCSVDELNFRLVKLDFK